MRAEVSGSQFLVTDYRRKFSPQQQVATSFGDLEPYDLFERSSDLTGRSEKIGPCRWFSSALAYEPDTHVLSIAITFKINADLFKVGGSSDRVMMRTT
jgi:hypothetical protein